MLRADNLERLSWRTATATYSACLKDFHSTTGRTGEDIENITLTYMAPTAVTGGFKCSLGHLQSPLNWGMGLDRALVPHDAEAQLLPFAACLERIVF